MLMCIFYNSGIWHWEAKVCSGPNLGESGYFFGIKVVHGVVTEYNLDLLTISEQQNVHIYLL